MSDKITAIYCRISTLQQKLDSQVDELNRWIEVHQPSKVRWYKDKFTGKTMERPSMTKLLDDLHKGKIDTIMVWRLDMLCYRSAFISYVFILQSLIL
jgi:DNA invertase Pin-like site-specific DNA recombinase